MSIFKIIDSSTKNNHTWFKLEPDDNTWLEDLADIYRKLRTTTNFEIQDIEFSGLTISANSIRERLLASQIPKEGKGNLRVERSDFGETIAYCFLDEQFGTRFGYKSLRDRELVEFTGRGIDTIGVERSDDVLRLVLGEVKTSSDKKSPPAVVDQKLDGLRNQHLEHLKNLEATSQKVMHSARHAKDLETQQLLSFAGVLLADNKDMEKLTIISYSCLVRQQDTFKESDFGSFKEKPGDFSPAHIRFAIFLVPGSVDKKVGEWLNASKEKGKK